MKDYTIAITTLAGAAGGTSAALPIALTNIGKYADSLRVCAKGVMCPIGSGSINYPAIRALLAKRDYGGYITIEQERDPRNTGSILGDLSASRAFLRRVGF